MIYVALLRGINVGGKNKIDMKMLKQSFERVGMESVQTYINTGNIIFSSRDKTATELPLILEEAIMEDFRLQIRVLVRSFPEIQNLMDALPSHWQNNAEMKSDIMFLWEEIDNKDIVARINPREGTGDSVDTVLYIPGTLLCSCDRRNQSKSFFVKLASSTEYKQMTIRNVNTTRNIHDIMSGKMAEFS